MKKGAVTVGFLHPGQQASCFVKSKTDLLLFDMAHKQRIMSHGFGELGLEAHAARINAARNELATTFLDHSPAEWLFMVDADMGFAEDTVERMILAAHPEDRPVIGGLCFGQKSDGRGQWYAKRNRIIPTLFSMYETDDEVGFVPMLDYPRDELVAIDATGAACLLIHRSALEKVRAEFGDRWFQPIEVPKGKNGYTEFSEDMSFCLRLKACGIQLYAHTGIQTTHDKGGIFLDEETYDLQTLTKRKADNRFSDWILATGGLMSPLECSELDYFASQATGPVLEVGNYTGLSTIVISNALPAGTPFITVDPHGWRETGDEFAANLDEYAGPVTSALASYEEFLAAYQGDRFRFVFYDGPHTPDDCEKFWKMLLPHLDPDAVVCWDDADWATMDRLRDLVAGSGRSDMSRHTLKRHQIAYSTGDPQTDLDLGKRHPGTYTLAVWG